MFVSSLCSILRPPSLFNATPLLSGLFRKHMMGKRVNYCCRSVISPDPYLGTCVRVHSVDLRP